MMRDERGSDNLDCHFREKDGKVFQICQPHQSKSNC